MKVKVLSNDSTVYVDSREYMTTETSRSVKFS